VSARVITLKFPSPATHQKADAMGFRFHKSFKFGPLRLNVNRSSMSVTAGVRGAHVTYNTRGQRTTSFGLPGTGLSYRTTTNVHGRQLRQPAPHDAPAPAAPVWGTSTLPMSTDESQFAVAVHEACGQPGHLAALNPWLGHPELGEAANVWLAILEGSEGYAVDEVNRLRWVVAQPPSLPSKGFYERHPVSLPLGLLGETVKIPVGRAIAAWIVAYGYLGAEPEFGPRDVGKAIQVLTQELGSCDPATAQLFTTTIAWLKTQAPQAAG